MKKGTKNSISLTLKLVIAISGLFYIYIKLTDSGQFHTLHSILPFNTRQWIFLCITILLMPLNWLLEAFKWRMLINPLEKILFKQSVKSVLAGITMSVFTPNRVGEFGGRIFFLKNADRLKALISSLMGSIAQLLVTLFFGSLAMCFYFFTVKQSFHNYLMQSISVFFVLSVLLALIVYLSPRIITLWLSGIKKWSDYTGVVSLYSSQKLFLILQLSVARYIVFSLQFFLLLKLFSVNIMVVDTFMMIALTFLGITIVPTITATELVVRGSAALIFFGEYSLNHAGIVSASFVLWLINIAAPAIAGTPFIFGLTFFRNKNE